MRQAFIIATKYFMLCKTIEDINGLINKEVKNFTHIEQFNLLLFSHTYCRKNDGTKSEMYLKLALMPVQYLYRQLVIIIQFAQTVNIFKVMSQAWTESGQFGET